MMTVIQKLDSVLEFFATNEKAKFYLHYADVIKYLTDNDTFEVNELNLILNKLVEDKFVQNTHVASSYVRETLNAYTITIKGQLFYLSGGYDKQAKLNKQKLLTQRLINFSLIFGGVAAGCYYIYQLYLGIYHC